MKAGEEETTRKYDPWELVTEAITRMKRNGDVMRSDRLKQVMQDIDSSFDEKNTGHSKFSKFVQDAAAKGLVTLTKLENGQLEVGMPGGAKPAAPAAPAAGDSTPTARPAAGDRPEGEERSGRRGRRGGRGRGRGGRGEAPQLELGATAAAAASGDKPAAAPAKGGDGIGMGGERLTRHEAFDLMRRAVETLTTADEIVKASAVRQRAHELLGRDSESLSERNFTRILQDAHDADVIDLRRRGDDFEVSRAVTAAPVADQLAAATAANAPATPATTPAPRIGMGHRGASTRGRGGKAVAPPPELLSVGVVKTAGAPAAEPKAAEEPAAEAAEAAGAKPAARKRGGRKRAASKTAKTASDATAGDEAAPKKKAPRKRRATKKTAKTDTDSSES
jgi:hypothetical protein